MFKHKVLDILVLGFFLILAPVISIVFNTNLLISVGLFYGLPSLYLSIREHKNIKRAAIFSFIFVILFFVLDYIAVQDGAWWVSTIFDFRLPGTVPIEDSIWVFFGIYTVVMFYKHFSDHKTQPKHTHIKYLLAIMGMVVLIFLTQIILLRPGYILPYAYFWLGMGTGVIPALIILTLYPALRYKFLKTQLYIFCLHLTFELTALHLGQWSFPGNHFVGWVELFNFRFPLEELLIWISMTAVMSLAYYEFYCDDRR